MAFADGAYARAAAESIRMKYAEIIAAWVECQGVVTLNEIWPILMLV